MATRRVGRRAPAIAPEPVTAVESRAAAAPSAGQSPLSVEQQLAVQYSISRAFAEGERLDDVAQLVLRTLADAFGWLTSSLWVLDDDSRELICVAAYATTPELESWIDETVQRRFPSGVGLPGRVWASGQPTWIRDTDSDENFPRRDVASAAGLGHGCAFPIRVRGAVRAVVEFFAADVRDVDVNTIEFLEAVGHQLGSFIERVDARRALTLSEARKTGVLQAAVDAIVTADKNGHILEFNLAAEALFERSRADVIGRTIAEILVPEDLRAAHERGLTRYVETGVPRILGQRVRTWGLRADGSRVPVELTVTEIRVGDEPMFTAFIRDITSERQAEIARDRFLEILSHELRTPVTAIYGGAKLLARPSIGGARRAALIDDIGLEADRLHRMVEDLIVLARAERGALAMSLEPVRLDRVASRLVTRWRSQSASVEFRLAESGTALAVQGDEIYVEQVLRNLVSNAIKYGGIGGTIDIEIAHSEQESEVRVLDRGPGFDAAEVGRLFEMDYRSPSTLGLATGSGVGLFVARWLTEGMGGRVWAAPRDGGGSEFGFALPAVRLDAPTGDVVSLD